MSRNKSLKSPASIAPTPDIVPIRSPLGVPPPLPTSDGIGDEEIRNLAYRKWIAAGSPDDDGIRFWLEAEQEVKGTQP